MSHGTSTVYCPEVAASVNFLSLHCPDMAQTMKILCEQFENGARLQGYLRQHIAEMSVLKGDPFYEEWSALQRVCADIANRADWGLLGDD